MSINCLNMTNNSDLNYSSNREVYKDFFCGISKSVLLALSIMILFSAASLVFADSSGSSLTFITKIQSWIKVLTGPIAQVLCVTIIVGAAVGYAFGGEDYKALCKNIIYIGICIAMAMGAWNIVEYFGGSDVVPNFLL